MAPSNESTLQNAKVLKNPVLTTMLVAVLAAVVDVIAFNRMLAAMYKIYSALSFAGWCGEQPDSSLAQGELGLLPLSSLNTPSNRIHALGIINPNLQSKRVSSSKYHNAILGERKLNAPTLLALLPFHQNLPTQSCKVVTASAQSQVR